MWRWETFLESFLFLRMPKTDLSLDLAETKYAIWLPGVFICIYIIPPFSDLNKILKILDLPERSLECNEKRPRNQNNLM